MSVKAKTKFYYFWKPQCSGCHWLKKCSVEKVVLKITVL